MNLEAVDEKTNSPAVCIAYASWALWSGKGDSQNSKQIHQNCIFKMISAEDLVYTFKYTQ